MKTIVTALALSLGFGATALAAPASTAAMGPVRAFIDGLNKGDIAAATAAHATDVSIIDEFPPHIWRGPKAFQTWLADFAKDKTVTEPVMTLGKTTRADVSADRAYLVVPATFTFKSKGEPMREPGQFVFVVRKAAGAWKIAAWAWAGGKARPVTAAAAAK